MHSFAETATDERDDDERGSHPQWRQQLIRSPLDVEPARVLPADQPAGRGIDERAEDAESQSKGKRHFSTVGLRWRPGPGTRFAGVDRVRPWLGMTMNQFAVAIRIRSFSPSPGSSGCAPA